MTPSYALTYRSDLQRFLIVIFTNLFASSVEFILSISFLSTPCFPRILIAAFAIEFIKKLLWIIFQYGVWGMGGQNTENFDPQIFLQDMKPSDYTGCDGTSRFAPFYVKESAQWTTEDVDNLGDFYIMQCEKDSSATISTASLYIIQVPHTYEGHEFLLIHDCDAFTASERCMEEELGSATENKKKRKRLSSVKIKCMGIYQRSISTSVDVDLQPDACQEMTVVEDEDKYCQDALKRIREVAQKISASL